MTKNKYKHQIIIAAYILLPLLLMIACLIRIDTVCKMQVDTLDQVMELRQDVDKLEPVEATASIDDITLCDDDRDVIERVVSAESRGEPYEGMVAVAQTIKDRGDLWGVRYIDVVTATGQYADPYQGEISDDVRYAVADVFDRGVRVSEEPITHFYSGSEPYWAADKVSRGQIGRHEFCY